MCSAATAGGWLNKSVCVEARVTELTRSINRKCMFHRGVGIVFLGSTAEAKSEGDWQFYPG